MASVVSRQPESLVPLDDDMEVTSDVERAQSEEEELIDIDLDDNFGRDNEDQNMMDDNLPDEEDAPPPLLNGHGGITQDDQGAGDLFDDADLFGDGDAMR